MPQTIRSAGYPLTLLALVCLAQPAAAYTIYVSDEKDNTIAVIDGDSLELVDTIAVGERPRVAQFTADGKEVWESSEIGGTVSVIDAETRKIRHKIEFEIPGLPPETIQPVGVRLSSDGSDRACIALGPSARVAVVNMGSYESEKYLLVGLRVWNLAFSPDQKRLFTTNGVSGDVSVIDRDRLRVIKSVKVGRLPWGIVVNP